MSSTFSNWTDYGIYMNNGSALVEGCSFTRSGPHIYLSCNVKAAAILGNTFTGGRNVVNKSISSEVKIDDTALNLPQLPTSATN